MLESASYCEPGLKLNACMHATETKTVLIHSSNKVVDRCLQLMVENTPIEQVCTFKFLGVAINDTLTWTDHKYMVCKKASYSLVPFCSLFSSLISSLSLTIVMLSGMDVPSLIPFTWSLCLTLLAKVFFIEVNTPLPLLLAMNFILVLSLPDESFTFPRLSSCICLLSQSPPYLSTIFSTPSFSHYT